MRRSPLRTVAAVSAAAVLLSACSGTPQSGGIGLPPEGITGVNQTTPAFPATHGLRSTTSSRVLYIADYGSGKVDILKYNRWTSLGSITNQISGPSGVWVDRNGMLYVSNFNTPRVTEYDAAGNLIFTYDANMVQPQAVTTDKYGIVYEADYSGVLNEYPPQRNSPVMSCTVAQNVQGVAVDKRGDVFASYLDDTGGHIAEYVHGLIASNCGATVLPAIAGFFPAGMAFDPQGNMIACNIFGAVDILAPPYAAITGTLGSGWTNPSGCTIDKAGTRVYVADPTAKTATILTYPGGATVATFGPANGFSEPASVVDSKNYVP